MQLSHRAVPRLVARRQSAARVRRRQRPAGLGQFPAARFLQAERPVADPGQPASLLRQPLPVPGQDAVRRLLPVRRRGQLRRRQLPARQCGALGRHRLSPPLAPLRPDLRDLRMAEHLVRPQHLPRRHDQRRPRARQLGRGSAQLRRRRRRTQPDAAHRLGTAVRRLPGGAGSHRSSTRATTAATSASILPASRCLSRTITTTTSAVRYSRPWRGPDRGRRGRSSDATFSENRSRACPDSCATAAMHARGTTAAWTTTIPTTAAPSQHGSRSCSSMPA